MKSLLVAPTRFSGLLLAVLTVAGLIGCSPGERRGAAVRFWHFWSEPNQRRVLDSLITEFKRLNPHIDVESTPLSWTDGKSKLQLAMNAGTQPDVMHLGLDWFSDFDQGGTFLELPNGDRSATWLVNARALVTWDPTMLHADRIGAFCVSDPHNVIKRVLPLLWSRGSRLYQRLPISEDLNDTLAKAIWDLLASSKGAICDRSRQIDELLLGGKVQSAMTGAWIVDMARARSITGLRAVPMPSILNADLLCISATSTVSQEAQKLIDFLCRYENARAFCQSVSDAGFPANLSQARSDTTFLLDSLQRGFLETALLSRPLVQSSRALAIEPIVESMLERCFAAPSYNDVVAAVSEARLAVRRVESR